MRDYHFTPESYLSMMREAVLDSNEHGDYLVYYMKARSLSAPREAAERSSHPIDAYHERFKAHTWETRSSLELLVDFQNFRFAKPS